MQIQVKSRGKGKTYWCIMQALMNDGIVITGRNQMATNINNEILPRVIKDFKENLNIDYDWRKIAFCINDSEIYNEVNKDKPIYIDEMDFVLHTLLKGRFNGGTISSGYCDFDLNKKDSEKICESVVRHPWEPTYEEEEI